MRKTFGRVLRLQVEGTWTPGEMGQLLTHLHDLYDLRLLFEPHERRDGRELWWTWWEVYFYRIPFFHRQVTKNILLTLLGEKTPFSPIRGMILPKHQLSLAYVKYGSPGSIDVLGLGQIIGHVKDLVVKLIDHFSSRELRQLGTEKARLENDRLRLTNAREFVSLAKELGYTDGELQAIVNWVDERQQTVVDLAGSGKLIGAKLLLRSRALPATESETIDEESG